MVLLSDSTGAEHPGFTLSEQPVEDAFDRILREAPGQVIIATFSSLIARIQQIVDIAARHHRKVATVGRSMRENVAMAQELGHLHIPSGLLMDISEMSALPPSKGVIIATGSQGGAALRSDAHVQEPTTRSQLNRRVQWSSPRASSLATRRRSIESSTGLSNKGLRCCYERIVPVDVSGHSSQQDQKLLLKLLEPRFFVPMHGELGHLHQHGRLAQEMGMPKKRIFVVENGYVLEFDGERGSLGERIPGGYVFVDGAGVDDVAAAVMRDGEILSQDGFVVAAVQLDPQTRRLIGEPQIVSCGFVYMRESAELIEEAQDVVARTVHRGRRDKGAIADRVRDALQEYLYEETRRRPMVMPVVWEDSRRWAAARAIMIDRPKRTSSPKRWSRIIIRHSNVQPVILNFSAAFRAAYTCTLQV